MLFRSNDLKDNQIKSFALDRMTELEISKKHFPFPADFNVNEHYKNCFGIISPNNQKIQEVVLSFTPFQGKYIKSLPLHETQEILKDNSDEVLVKLTLYVTLDFIMEILSFGDNVKVIAPDDLIEELKITYQNALNQY